MLYVQSFRKNLLVQCAKKNTATVSMPNEVLKSSFIFSTFCHSHFQRPRSFRGTKNHDLCPAPVCAIHGCSAQTHSLLDEYWSEVTILAANQKVLWPLEMRM